MERILVTGAGSWIGGRVVQRLELRPDLEVFAVDDRPPVLEFASEFYRGEIDQLDFAGYLLEVRPHTVLHLEAIDRHGAGGMVLGAQALFGAIERCRDTTRVVIKSDGAIYGAGPRLASVFSEEAAFRPGRLRRHQRRLRELEEFVTTMAGRHPAVGYTVLRFASILGPHVGNPISRYLTLRIVPTRAGFDPRLQFVYEEDAVRAILHAADHPVTGAFNVAAQGQIYLSRALRLGGRLQQPLPGRVFRSAVRAMRNIDVELTEDMEALLKYGRVMDTLRMREELRFSPAMDCRQTVLASYQRIPPSAMPTEVVNA